MLEAYLSSAIQGRIGLCCGFVVLPSCIALVSMINRDVDAYQWGGSVVWACVMTW